MPELAEVRIMSDYINHYSKDRVWTDVWDVKKGNQFINLNIDLNEKGILTSKSRGKELFLYLGDIHISVFMGMNGNWKLTPTQEVNNTKYIRLRFDSADNKSLILYGGYMGPKWRFGKFIGSKRGPDPVEEYDLFVDNILNNASKKEFQKPIYEMLLDQKYFNGIGNYLRSTILYYSDINPFMKTIDVITTCGERLFEFCRDIPLKAYKLNGGQLKDWSNPFGYEHKEFDEWVYYKKGLSLKDSNNRTFWYNPKWENFNNI